MRPQWGKWRRAACKHVLPRRRTQPWDWWSLANKGTFPSCDKGSGQTAVGRNFAPFCYTITFMHMHCTEQVWSYSLEFCPGGLYKNKLRACLLAQLLFSLWPECVCLLYVWLVVLCHFTRNLQKSPTSGAQRGARVKLKGWAIPGGF